LTKIPCFKNKSLATDFADFTINISVKFVKFEGKAIPDVSVDFVMGCFLRQEQKLTADTPPVRSGKKRAIQC
jgi:hypothetical protein